MIIQLSFGATATGNRDISSNNAASPWGGPYPASAPLGYGQVIQSEDPTTHTHTHPSHLGCIHGTHFLLHTPIPIVIPLYDV